MIYLLIMGFWFYVNYIISCHLLSLSYFSAGANIEKGGRNASAALTQISKVTTGFVPIGGIEIILVIVPGKI